MAVNLKQIEEELRRIGVPVPERATRAGGSMWSAEHSEALAGLEVCDLQRPEIADTANETNGSTSFKEQDRLMVDDTECRRLGSTTREYSSTTRTPTNRNDAVWNRAFKLFPALDGVSPRGKHVLAVNQFKQQYLLYSLYSNAWTGNPQNHQHKRRQAYAGISPKLQAGGPWYGRDIPVDDLGLDGGKNRLEALLTATKRANPDEGHLLGIDNQLARGCERYLSNVPLKGFAPVLDPQSWLVESLRAIRPPSKGEAGKAFHPIHGTRVIKKAAEKPADDDFKTLKEIATQSDGSMDLLALEAEAHELGMTPLYVNGRIKRAQCSPGYLKGHYNNIGEVLVYARRCFGDKGMTKFGRDLAFAQSGAAMQGLALV